MTTPSIRHASSIVDTQSHRRPRARGTRSSPNLVDCQIAGWGRQNALTLWLQDEGAAARGGRDAAGRVLQVMSGRRAGVAILVVVVRVGPTALRLTPLLTVAARLFLFSTATHNPSSQSPPVSLSSALRLTNLPHGRRRGARPTARARALSLQAVEFHDDDTLRDLRCERARRRRARTAATLVLSSDARIVTRRSVPRLSAMIDFDSNRRAAL